VEDLGRFLNSLPSSMVVGLGCRYASSLGLAKHELAGNVLRLDLEDLTLTSEDLRDLSGSLSQRQIDAVMERTQGWVAAFEVAWAEVRGGFAASSRARAVLERYVDQEVLEPLSPALVHTLALAAIAEAPLRLDVVASTPEGAHLFEELRQHAIPLITLPSDPPTIAVRGWLARQLTSHRRPLPSEARSLAAVFQRDLIARGHLRNGLLIAERVLPRDDFIQTVLDCAPLLALQGHMDVLEELLDRFEPGDHDRWPQLSLSRAFHAGFSGDGRQTQAWLDDFERRAHHDVTLYPEVAHMLTAFTDSRPSIELTSEAIARGGWARIMAWILRGLNSLGTGDFEDVRACFSVLKPYAARFPVLGMFYASAVSLALLETGDPDGALEVVHAYSTLWEQGLKELAITVEMSCMIAWAAARQGDISRATGAVDHALDQLDRVGTSFPVLTGCCYLALARTAVALNDTTLISQLLHRITPLNEADLGIYPSAQLRSFQQQYATKKTSPVPGLGLTTQELRVLRELATHRSVPEIAHHMHLSPATVRVHIHKTYKKLQVHARSEAVATARRAGLIPSD